MPNYENFFVYEYWQFEVIRHVFGFATAVFAAAFVYFVLTVSTTRPTFRESAYISAVVMVSATIELGNIWLMWDRAFEIDAATGTVTLIPGHVFTNGFRYANWFIDVPMLLTQFLIVLGFVAGEFRRRWVRLAGAGVAMIALGYVGQYWEPQVAGFLPGSGWGFWVFGGLSWLVFFYLIWQAKDAFDAGIRTLVPRAAATMTSAWHVLLVSWFVYGFVYLVPGIPGLNESATMVMVRQMLYSAADITSKVLFGVLLSRVAIIQSAHSGREVQTLGGAPEAGPSEASDPARVSARARSAQ